MIFPLRRYAALDKPATSLYNAASSEEQALRTRLHRPSMATQTEHQAKKCCFRNGPVSPFRSRMKLLKCLLSRL